MLKEARTAMFGPLFFVFYFIQQNLEIQIRAFSKHPDFKKKTLRPARTGVRPNGALKPVEYEQHTKHGNKKIK